MGAPKAERKNTKIKCRVVDVWELLAKQYTFDILDYLYHEGPSRYIHIFEYLKTKAQYGNAVSSKTAVERIKLLVERGLVVKNKPYYDLTEKGKEIINCLHKVK